MQDKIVIGGHEFIPLFDNREIKHRTADLAAHLYKENCPVYKLYCLKSRSKTKTDWSTAQGNCDFNPGLQPEVI